MAAMQLEPWLWALITTTNNNNNNTEHALPIMQYKTRT
jgi:hypothetical protein